MDLLGLMGLMGLVDLSEVEAFARLDLTCYLVGGLARDLAEAKVSDISNVADSRTTTESSTESNSESSVESNIELGV